MSAILLRNRFGKRRKYPIKKDEYGRTRRRWAFHYFDEGKSVAMWRLSQVMREIAECQETPTNDLKGRKGEPTRRRHGLERSQSRGSS